MAFATRHERLGDRPVIVLYGHLSGMVALFGEGCESGGRRRRTFPLAPGPPVGSRHHVVHCSDGLLAGERESRALSGILDSWAADGHRERATTSVSSLDPRIVGMLAADPDLERPDDVPFGQWSLDKRADDLLF